MNAQEIFYVLGIIASVLAITTCFSILFVVVRIYSMIKTAQVAMAAMARTRVAGGALTLLPILVNAFLRRKRA